MGAQERRFAQNLQPNVTLMLKTQLPGALAMAAALITLAVAAPARGAESGFQSIFNGQDLTGWDGNPKLWSVQDGAITGQTTLNNPAPGNTFLVWTNGTVADFELRCSFKMVPGDSRGFANSGIQYPQQDLRPQELGRRRLPGRYGGRPNYTGNLYEERIRGTMAERGQKVVYSADGKQHVTGSVGNAAEIEASIKKGDWNDYVIIAKGNHLQQFLNGRQTVDVTDEDQAHRALSGILALQLHAGPPMMVQFKDIRIKTLSAADAKKIVFLAGPPSHGPREHEHRAGCLLLASCLDQVPGITCEVYSNGWPQNAEAAFADAAAIVVYSDGGSGHPLLQDDRLKVIGALMDKGAGLALLHYAVEATKEKGEKEFIQWVGGCFETDWSVNPTWKADFKTLPRRAVLRGVNPFAITDEWYFHMRFSDDAQAVRPILSAVAPESTMDRPDGPHEGNPAVRESVKRGDPQVVAWTCRRPDGGCGFGFTGGHFHKNWGNENVRKLVLNAILWTAKADVPPEGVESKVSAEDLEKNLDKKR